MPLTCSVTFVPTGKGVGDWTVMRPWSVCGTSWLLAFATTLADRVWPCVRLGVSGVARTDARMEGEAAALAGVAVGGPLGGTELLIVVPKADARASRHRPRRRYSDDA